MTTTCPSVSTRLVGPVGVCVLESGDVDVGAALDELTARAAALARTGGTEALVVEVDTDRLPELAPGSAAGWESIRSLPLPTVVALPGSTLAGAALALALAFDLRVLADGATVGRDEVGLGLELPHGPARLAAVMGRGRALEALYAGRALDAREALTHGAVTEVHPRERVVEAAIETAVRLASGPAAALRAVKAAVGPVPYDGGARPPGNEAASPADTSMRAVAPDGANATGDPAPLAGVTVVAIEQAVSAPLCTRTLGDFGARVIKIERPGIGDFTREYDDVVDGLAAHFVWLARGKQSVSLDLRHPAALEIVHRLLERADVLVSNLAPGALERLGLDPAGVTTRHPHLITVAISGYGAGGPLSGKRAYDMLVHAETGGAAITGGPEAPAKPGPPFADATTGLCAANAVLAALHRRRDTGRGTAIEISMFDVMIEMMGFPLTWSAYTGLDQQRVGMGSPAVVPYGAYPTSDGRTVVLGTTNDAEWQRFAGTLLARDDLAADPRFRRNVDRVRHRELLDAEIGAWCARRTLAEVMRAAEAAGIGNAVLRVPTEVVDHPQLTARDRWQSVSSPVGAVRTVRPPAFLDGAALSPGAVPGLGEHTDTVLAELGYGTEARLSLREDGVVA